MKKLLLIGCLLLVGASAFCQKADSLKVMPKKKARLRSSVIFHSMGQFQFGGRLVSNNPVANLSINYDRKTWGFFVFKALDLKDSHTDINFTLAAFNKNFKIGKRLTITPTVGV